MEYYSCLCLALVFVPSPTATTQIQKGQCHFPKVTYFPENATTVFAKSKTEY